MIYVIAGIHQTLDLTKTFSFRSPCRPKSSGNPEQKTWITRHKNVGGAPWFKNPSNLPQGIFWLQHMVQQTGVNNSIKGAVCER